MLKAQQNKIHQSIRQFANKKENAGHVCVYGRLRFAINAAKKKTIKRHSTKSIIAAIGHEWDHKYPNLFFPFYAKKKVADDDNIRCVHKTLNIAVNAVFLL